MFNAASSSYITHHYQESRKHLRLMKVLFGFSYSALAVK